MTPTNGYLDPTRRGTVTQAIEEALQAGVIAQNHVHAALLPAFRRLTVGLNDTRRPIGTFLFLGPTGVGKTLTVEVLAEYFHKDPKHILRIDGAEFRDAHEVAKLLGAPPGYVGGETLPRLHQTNVDKYGDKAKGKPTLVLFDEIEKAHHSIWEVTLGITSNAGVTVGDNSTTDFSNTIVVFTSNLGAREIERMGKSTGFTTPEVTEADKTTRHRNRLSMEAAQKHFTPEFLGRMDATVTFNALGMEELRGVLDRELYKVQQRFLAAKGVRIIFEATQGAKQWMLNNGADTKRGARDLSQLIERSLVTDLAALVETEQVEPGGLVTVDVVENHLVYATREMDPTTLP